MNDCRTDGMSIGSITLWHRVETVAVMLEGLPGVALASSGMMSSHLRCCLQPGS